MALDASFTGRTYPPLAVFEVTREMIAEFADSVGDSNPAYRSAEAAAALGHPDVIASPTFPIRVTWPAAQRVINDPDLGLDFTRVVHGDQRFVYQRPVRAGDRLLATVVIEDIMNRGGAGFLTTRTDLATEDGEHVVTGFAKLVVRAADSEGDAS